MKSQSPKKHASGVRGFLFLKTFTFAEGCCIMLWRIVLNSSRYRNAGNDMVNRKRTAMMKEPPPFNPDARPEVIVEFLFEEGLLFIAVRNIGEKPALSIEIRFDKKFYGAESKKEISALALFKNIEFLGPQREIVAFLDQSSSYFGGQQPTRIQAKVSYSDAQRNKYEETINHNLEIYRELPYLNRSGCEDKNQ